jgi:hypothetical protein
VKQLNTCNLFAIQNVLKQGYASSPLLLNFAFEYAIRKARESQEGMELSETHQFLVCTDDVHILGESINAIKKNTAALLKASKEVGLEVNVEKTKSKS